MGGENIMSVEYVAAKAHVLRTYLIAPSYIRDYLVGARTLKDIASGLSMTYYRDKLVSLGQKVTKEDLIRVINGVFEERYAILTKQLPDPFSSFVDAYIFRFDIRSLLRIMGEIIANIPHGPVSSYGYAFSKINYGQLLKIGSMEDLLSALSYTPLKSAVPLITELWEKYQSLHAVELALWSSYYRMLISFLQELPSDVRDPIWRVIGTEIDLVNISVILGPMIYGYSIDYLDRLLIEKTLRVSIANLKKVYGLEPELITSVVPDVYREVVEKFLTGRDYQAKTLAERIVLREVLSILPRNPAGFEFIFGVLKLFEFECENLRALIESVAYGLEKDIIKELMVV